MAIKIEFKFQPGDEAYVIWKRKITKTKIKSVKFESEKNYNSMRYEVEVSGSQFIWFNADEVFNTPEELAQSLLDEHKK